MRDLVFVDLQHVFVDISTGVGCSSKGRWFVDDDRCCDAVFGEPDSITVDQKGMTVGA